jgi:hypothetical protein
MTAWDISQRRLKPARDAASAFVHGFEELTSQILYKTARKFLAEAQSSQRKPKNNSPGKTFGFWF